MKEMTSLERCLAVLNQQEPDILPVIPQAFMFAVEHAGYTCGDVRRNGKLMAEAHKMCQEEFGYDGCVIDFDDASTVEAIGSKVIYREDEPAIVDEEYPVLKDLRDVYDLEVPDPLKSGRLCEWLEATSRLVEAIGDHVLVMGRADQGPFSMACGLRGTTQFMMDLLTEDKQVIKDVLDYCRKVHVAFAKAQKDAGAHWTSMGDSYAGLSLLSPEMYREFAFDQECLSTKEIQDYGIPFAIHICGKTNEIIEDMGNTGARILEVDWQVDMAEALKHIPSTTVLMGNIDPSFPLVTGSPDEVKDAVKNLILETKGRQLIISSGCALGRNTPAKNVEAFVEASRLYGSQEFLNSIR